MVSLSKDKRKPDCTLYSNTALHSVQGNRTLNPLTFPNPESIRALAVAVEIANQIIYEEET
jgi:hypothetical protein